MIGFRGEKNTLLTISFVLNQKKQPGVLTRSEEEDDTRILMYIHNTLFIDN